MHIYTFYAVARCPVQEQLDIYEAIAQSKEVIPCETIAKVILELSTEVIFQETLAKKLADQLGCKVTLSGSHSGVTVISTAFGP